MDLNSAIVLDLEGHTQYFVQIASEAYCSPKFWEAFENKESLSAQDLIQEDHYQLFVTLCKVCKDRKDLTEETKFMLEILRSTNTIESAFNIISRRLKFMNKIFRKIRESPMEIGNFAISILRNLDSGNLGNN
jgi:hypothetical protein